MMILVDTTVWIDFFANRTISHVAILESLIKQKEDLCICGIILTEILQGIRHETEFKKVKNLCNTFIFLPMRYKTFYRSAEIYRKLRQKGITIRKPTDCMIASVAIENNIILLHNDKDFLPIEKYCDLKLYYSNLGFS
ncbi:MAG: PIN domain nuclease [bacterium]